MGLGRGRGEGYGEGTGEGAGGALGCGFICSLLCMVVAWVTFATCMTSLLLPMWETGENYTSADNQTFPNYYKGLYLCCRNFSKDNFDCFPCSENAVGNLLSWEYACQALFTIATACLLVIAFGSVLMVCDKCRGCITSAIYTVLCGIAFVCTLVTVVLYAVSRGEKDLGFDIAFYLACVSVPLTLVSSIIFCQAIFTTMDCCPCC